MTGVACAHLWIACSVFRRYVAEITFLPSLLNVSLIAFNWHLPAEDRYFPSIPEIGTTVFIVTLGVVVYRFIATRMPILHEHPEYKEAH